MQLLLEKGARWDRQDYDGTQSSLSMCCSPSPPLSLCVGVSMSCMCIGGVGKTALEWAKGTGESAYLLREWAAEYGHLSKGSTNGETLRQERPADGEAVTAAKSAQQLRLQGNPRAQSEQTDRRPRRAGCLIVAGALLALLLWIESAIGGRNRIAHDDTPPVPATSSLLQSTCMESMAGSSLVGSAASNEAKSLQLWRCLRTAEQQADVELLMGSSGGLWSVWPRWMTP